MVTAGKPRFPDLDLWPEDLLHSGGLPSRWVAGVDEAGRGPLAGPVVAAVVVLADPDPKVLPGLQDSKKLTRDQREKAFDLIHRELGKKVVSFGVGSASCHEIDQTDILRATHLAASRALKQLSVWPELLLTDALTLPDPSWSGRQVPLIKGDGRCLSIAAASILAKVTRDRLMTALSSQYPVYGFDRHAGYPTPEHYRALDQYGPCALHRHSFLQSWRTGKNSSDGHHDSSQDE